MGGFVITEEKFPKIPDDIISKWKDNNFHLTIEEIYDDLKSVFSDDQLQDLETDYVGFSILRKYPDEIIPADFLNKISAIIAINVNPYEYTNDLIAFANMITVCNDVPMMDINIGIVPSRFISRLLTAVQLITPNELDFNEVYFHNNIQNYIFQCYYKDSFYILDSRLSQTYNIQFLNNSGLPKETIKLILNFRPLTKDIKEFIDKNTDENIFESEDQKKAIEEMFVELNNANNVPGFVKEQFRKFSLNYMYDKYYKIIFKKTGEQK